MCANFTCTQHLHIWAVGARQYCVRKDFDGAWTSIGGLSPGLTGTISDGLTGTFTATEFWEWTGTLSPSAPTSGYLGEVDAGCTAVDVCADNSYLIVDNLYFPQSTQHCNSVREDIEVARQFQIRNIRLVEQGKLEVHEAAIGKVFASELQERLGQAEGHQRLANGP